MLSEYFHCWWCWWLLGPLGIRLGAGEWEAVFCAHLIAVLSARLHVVCYACFCSFVDVVLLLWYQNWLFYSRRGWLSWLVISLISSRGQVQIKYRAVWKQVQSELKFNTDIVLSAHTMWKLPISEITLLTKNTMNMTCTQDTHSTEWVLVETSDKHWVGDRTFSL